MITPKQNQQILIGIAIIFRDNRGKRQWFVVKQKEDGEWELPKVTVRKGESSVRAVIRLTGEQAGMATEVLEEAGRATGTTIVNGKSISQKFYYYLMILKAGGADAIGFNDFIWLENAQAMKKVTIKREREMLRSAKDILKEWEKTHNKKQQF